ncbi:hypothetical protein BerOc1_03696 [Pseudodesulfovibrio hydrargyri]|uniref:DUF169 domain-containing protein n=1 Tax=Pseudodesulfovibrio hydrargyri TaxID=2125990 RepID=A0A1J5MSU2_9BACT|nr:DUF169 domain-containing protein [Pseudodesulfovibrio hydrargyri]OIQ48940.1 hypothetical protein BerOc1_03696 [Pseudodesulfovibrio hydrargyri]
MKPDVKRLVETVGIETPLIGYYNVQDTEGFGAFAKPGSCIFASIDQCFQGEYIHVSPDDFKCIGARYWMCGVETLPREKFAHMLAEGEGLKCSTDLMGKWLDSQPPFKGEYEHIVVGPLKDDQYDSLKSVTFYVTPDQLACLVMACEYDNAGVNPPPVQAPFGSGCAQLAAVLRDFDLPKAVIGATDLGMRKYLPENILAFTVTKSMFERICNLDENSFLHKSLWRKLTEARGNRPETGAEG